MSTFNEKLKTQLFAEYLKYHGLQINDKTIEIGSAVYDSISQFLENYETFLLSDKVNYDELDELGLNGAQGFIRRGSIIVPKTAENDKHLSIRNDKKSKKSYNVPSLSDFQTLIARSNEVDFDQLISSVIGSSLKVYCGLTYKLDERKNFNSKFNMPSEAFSLYGLAAMSESWGYNRQLEFVKDEIKQDNLGVCLVYRKK